MGYLTTISLYNDSVHKLNELTPKEAQEFCKKIFQGVCTSSAEKPVTISLKGHVNFMTILPSRHADDHTIYINMGNCLTEVLPWTDSFKEKAEKFPDFYNGIYYFLKAELAQLKKVLKLK